MNKLEFLIQKPALYALCKVLKEGKLLTSEDVQNILANNQNGYKKLQDLIRNNKSTFMFVVAALGLYNTTLSVIFTKIFKMKINSLAQKISEKMNQHLQQTKESKSKRFLVFVFNPKTHTFEKLLLNSIDVVIFDSTRFIFSKLGLSKVYEIITLPMVFMKIQKFSIKINENDAKDYEILEAYIKWVQEELAVTGWTSADSLVLEEVRKFSKIVSASGNIYKYARNDFPCGFVKDDLIKAAKEEQKQLESKMAKQAIVSVFPTVKPIVNKLISIVSSYLHSKEKHTSAFIISWITTTFMIAFLDYIQQQ